MPEIYAMKKARVHIIPQPNRTKAVNGWSVSYESPDTGKHTARVYATQALAIKAAREIAPTLPVFEWQTYVTVDRVGCASFSLHVLIGPSLDIFDHRGETPVQVWTGK